MKLSLISFNQTCKSHNFFSKPSYAVIAAILLSIVSDKTHVPRDRNFLLIA